MPTGRKGTDFTFLGENCNANSDAIDDIDDSDDLMTHFCISIFACRANKYIQMMILMTYFCIYLYLRARHTAKRAPRVTGD